MTRERANEILARWKAGDWFDERLIQLALIHTGDLNEDHLPHA